MIKRPLIEEMSTDNEYLNTIKDGNTEINKWIATDRWIAWGGMTVYFVVGYALGIKIEHLWMIGFPFILVLEFLKYICGNASVSTYEGGRTYEYYNKHLLHRLEEMHKTLEK
tara:strand:- start:31 stop:366 length:336 start_codon:yes stop_codon:yes gene_type:complete